MALLGNYSVLSKHPGRNFGGGAIGLGLNRSDFNKSGANRNFYAGEATVISAASIANKNAFPSGYVHPYAWVLAQKAGGMASRVFITGSAGVTAANLAGGLNAEAPLTGSGDITNAALGLILSAVANLTGSGTISNAAILGKLEAVAALTGTGDLTGALGALASLVGALTGTGTITNAGTAASGSMSADINVTGDLLSTSNVASAIWGALAAAMNDPGTMGELLNATGGGASPTIIADAILLRSLAGGADGGRTVQDALRAIRNRTALAAGTLTVYEEDDATPAWTATVSTGTRDPLTGIDPS